MVYGTRLLLAFHNGKTHLAIALGAEAVKKGYKVVFITMDELIRHLKVQSVPTASRQKVKRILGSDLVIIDEIGFLPVSRQEANLLFQLVTALYEQNRRPSSSLLTRGLRIR